MAAEANGTAVPSTAGEVHDPFRITAREWGLLLVLALVQFTHVVDFVIIMPLGPTFQDPDGMGLSKGEFGTVVAAYGIGAGIASLFAAYFLDRFDRKSVLLTLYTGFGVSTFLCACAPSYAPLLAARAIAGAFGGVAAAVVLAIVGDVFPDARRGAATGVIMSSFSVAMIVGIPLGLFLAGLWGWNSVFLVLAALSAFTLLGALALLPPLRGHLDGDSKSTGASGTFLQRLLRTWSVLFDPNHLRAFALMMTLVLTSFLIVPEMPTFIVNTVGMPKDMLIVMYLSGGLTTLFTLTFFGRLADRLGKLRVFRLIALATVVPILAVTLMRPGLSVPWILCTTTLFMVLTSGRMVPALALITSSSSPEERGSFMQFNNATQHFASGIAAGISGQLLEYVGDPTVGYAVVGVIACGFNLLSIYLAGRLRPAIGGEAAPDALSEVEADTGQAHTGQTHTNMGSIEGF